VFLNLIRYLWASESPPVHAGELYGERNDARYAEQTPVSTTRDDVRNGLILDALGKPVDLNAVDWHVRQRNPPASPSEVQNETLEVIRGLVSDGLFMLGAVDEKDERFVAWNHALDYSIHKISHDYVKHYDDPEKWMFSVWMLLTVKGEQLARSLEEKNIDGYRSRPT
jgi:hypothetical protein